MTPQHTWTPSLHLDARPDRCRLTLVGITYGNGTTLQEAGNDLLVRLHDLAIGMQRNGFQGDPQVGHFLWEIGEVIKDGGDLRERVFAS